ncbi:MULTISPECIES: glutamate--tRNA ligase [Nitrosomonas]|uniref:Glutamate--tRNA ligase n=1 Tax=Nitrosomonas communis TaxID=44574 RepID=A0A0F7KF19_9PROT|nr:MULTISPECIES: glutamate--tRNA ligase [Nitrosomonas]AKH37427.1 glutamyl-tRNA synthetase [Nitrosomonas communis]TYP91386.1 glutamyl-tRNA synthetase [Nitrosomonas communis]UVS62654.1 glutamate--tRNA ligase [Nitrosomonas sp. PLL12]
MVRTRFAPSPTGYLHIGGARTALFSWAFARKHGGKFILRIEDTDLERSTQLSVQAILDGMAWLGLDYDEGPFYQMQRLARYHEVAEQLLQNNLAYRCYASKEELDLLREQQRAAGLKPRYDGRWRDAKQPPPAEVKPVIRFKNPTEGHVVFDDLVKGKIVVANSELDDLVLLRSDGIPTYNFGVIVDDLDMNISHVIRGDDHVNNTPRQINILKALDAPIPQYAHVPMILGADGERLSKRHGAVSVMHYHEEGYLPEAMINYLARLGWSHGDEEIFSTDQLIEWFDLATISRSPAKFNPEKLMWLNQHYLKNKEEVHIAELMTPFLEQDGCHIPNQQYLLKVINLLKERVNTISELADAAVYFFRPLEPSYDLKAQYFNPEAKSILLYLIDKFNSLDWNRQAIQDEIKKAAATFNVKLPKVAMPLRIVITGEAQTPSIDAILELLGRTETLKRINQQISYFPD